MTPEESRRRFAKALGAATGVDDPRVVRAFEAVPRERFLGAGPWMILGREGYVASPTSDPAILYDDIVVALAPDKRINNGQPSLHARCLSVATIRAGERVLHIGCGSGYYSAILAELVTPSGAVQAWDLEPALVDAARENLRPWASVSVSLRSGASPPIPESDFIYVCAGCTRPMLEWLGALSDGGRLLFPLTPGWEYGGMLLVTRVADRYRAGFVCKCAFIPCNGGSDAAGERALRAALSSGGMDRVAELRLGSAAGRDDAWLAGDGWWLRAEPAVA